MQCSYRDGSFIQYYASGRWNTSQLDIVIAVNTTHPILIRLLPSVVAPLTDCPGLEDELRSQPRGSNKRQAAIDLVSPPKKISHRAEDGDIASARSSQDRRKAADLTNFPNTLESSEVSPISTTQSTSQKNKSTSRLAPFPLDLSTKEEPAGPSMKSIAWPRDFTVSEIVAGLASISAKMDASQKTTQRDAFLEVFPGAKYHKSQIANVRTILSRVGEKVKMHHSRYGKGPKGTWTAFKKCLPNTILDRNFADKNVIEKLEDELSSPCLSDDDDPWGTGKSSNTPKSPRAPSTVIDPSISLSDAESEPVNRCPWCDLEMPADFEPSPMLLALREDLMKVSLPDPVPGFNPDHRKVESATLFMPHCERHRLETNIWPIAQQEGWPRVIDFSQLPDRVRRLQGILGTLLVLDERQDNEFFKPLIDSFEPGTSRAAASSAKSSYASFNGHSAG